MRNSLAISLRSLAIGVAALLLSGLALGQRYQQTNLVSNDSTVGAKTIDPNIRNPWGLTRGAGSPWWINSEKSGVSSLYDGQGNNIAGLPFVTVPNAPGVQGPSSPSGLIFNGTTDFAVAPGKPGIFIFATKNGAIAAWNPGVNLRNAVTMVNEAPSGAVFTGLTWVEVHGKHFLLAANFNSGKVEAFDANFARVRFSEEAFDDDRIPQGFAAYNVQVAGSNVVVTFAQQNATKSAAVIGDGLGFVDVFTLEGRLVHRLERKSDETDLFNAPWGVTLTPQDFGVFSHSLLIGNRGSGTVAAFDPVSGRFLGNMLDESGNTLAIPGLWALEFGNNATAGSSLSLYFVAGIEAYASGLFGTLTPDAGELNAEDHQ